jgi:hypothetical protein
VNYIAQYNLSWFRPLLRDNSHTYIDLILKMNSDYNGVSLKSSRTEGKNDLIPPA